MIMEELDFMDNWDIALSQTSIFTDCLPLDNAGLMVPCSQDFTPGWIVDRSQPTFSQSYTLQANGSQQFATIPLTSTTHVSNQSTTTGFTNTAESVGFSDQYGSVALSPESIPPGSPNSSTDGDTMPGPDSQEIMDQLDETLGNNMTLLKNEDFESLLSILANSQGTEFLSQSTKNGDCVDLALINQVSEGQNSIEVTHGSLIPVKPTLPVAEIQPVVSSEKTERPSNKRKRSEDVLTPSTKKRNQNKEAAKRYREKKKTEAEIHAMEKEELQKVKSALIDKIEKIAGQRDTLLRELAQNPKPNAFISYPDWLTLESD